VLEIPALKTPPPLVQHQELYTHRAGINPYVEHQGNPSCYTKNYKPKVIKIPGTCSIPLTNFPRGADKICQPSTPLPEKPLIFKRLQYGMVPAILRGKRVMEGGERGKEA
jgi:hypothetical protein